MWRVLIGVGVVVLLVIGVAVWFFTAASPVPGDEAAGEAAPGPSVTVSPGPRPDATPTTGSEVLPPTPSETGLPGLEPAAPLVPSPLPASASGGAELVEGYPVEVMGPAEGADVVQNSIATEGDVMQVSLVARTDASPDALSAHYAELWASLGLMPQPASGDGSVSFTGAYDSLTLAFTPASGTGTVYMIQAVFRGK
ncbi:hypothetical protein ACFT30_11745 [Microbacterium ureisolvens]|uniref:hypothetical protein n=1 Tax=Microbacterium ureisolvens TaxID=2781186 RepID=UPI00362ADC50